MSGCGALLVHLPDQLVSVVAAEWGDMKHRTRSGKQFKLNLSIEQPSCWGNPSEVLHVVLPSFLDHEDLLQARLVCRAWRAAFNRSIKHLQLVQPMSAGTARALARKAAAAFPCSTTLRIMLYHNDEAELSLDMTADDEAPICTSNTKLDRPEAAAALLRQFTKAVSLQELQLQLQHLGRFSGVSRMLPLVPELRVLDLSGVYHESADLLVIAQHQPHLQQLLLHCPQFTTLAGCRKSSGDASWARQGVCGVTRYEPAHVAALGQLAQLRHLECPVPTGGSSMKMSVGNYAHPWACEWLKSIAQLTQLTALHLIQGKGAWAGYPLPTMGVTCLSSLTGLRHLRADCGGGQFAACHGVGIGAQQAKSWAVALRGMQQLTRLEMTRALVCDPLLLSVGAAGLPQLQVLVLETLDMLEEVTSSAASAGAVAHIPRVELLFQKGMLCKQHLPLFGLPNLKRLLNCSYYGGAGEMQRWTQAECPCMICWQNRSLAQWQ